MLASMAYKEYCTYKASLIPRRLQKKIGFNNSDPSMTWAHHLLSAPAIAVRKVSIKQIFHKSSYCKLGRNFFYIELSLTPSFAQDKNSWDSGKMAHCVGLGDV